MTLSCSPSWTGSPGRCLMLATSWTSSPGGTSSSASAGSIHDPTDPVGRLLFNVLAMVAEFESDLIRMRTREGMKVAKAKGRLHGKQPKLKPNQAKHLFRAARLRQATPKLSSPITTYGTGQPVRVVPVKPVQAP